MACSSVSSTRVLVPHRLTAAVRRAPRRLRRGAGFSQLPDVTTALCCAFDPRRFRVSQQIRAQRGMSRNQHPSSPIGCLMPGTHVVSTGPAPSISLLVSITPALQSDFLQTARCALNSS